MNCLYTLDMKAVNHILVNSYIYQKPEASRYSMSLLIGHGLVVVEEDKHKQQVRLPFGKFISNCIHGTFSGKLWQYLFIHHFLCCFSDTTHQNPAFGAAQIRELTEIFVEKSIQARMHFIWSKSDLNNTHIPSFAIYGPRKVAKKDRMGASTYYGGWVKWHWMSSDWRVCRCYLTAQLIHYVVLIFLFRFQLPVWGLDERSQGEWAESSILHYLST